MALTMEEDKNKTVDTVQPAVVAESTLIDDSEARFAELEAEKAKIVAERDNYKTGMLKAKAKLKEEPAELNEDEEDRVKRLVDERIAESRLVEIAREQDALLKKALKENKELKLAQLNKKEPIAAQGAHSEGTAVVDTSITPEQLAEFKRRGWTDKDIERYKTNLRKKV